MINKFTSMNICCIFNYPPHYRKAIYHKMDNELNCDFYFGDSVPGTLADMNCSDLKGFKGRVKNIIKGRHIVWQKGIIRLLFRPYKYYIMTVDTAALSNWVFVYMGWLLGKKIYFWTHGCRGGETFFARVKNRLFFTPSEGLFLYSEYAKHLLVNQGYSTEKLHVIANSLDYDVHVQLRKSLIKNDVYRTHFCNEYPTLIFTGRLEPGKKLHQILEAMAHLREYGSYINLVLVGEGNSRELLVQLAEDLQISKNIWFYGACYDERQLSDLIYNADICISPGNIGLTAIHALSFGTPIATHSNFRNQMPEFEAIIPEVNGTFFVENDTESLCKSISEWLIKHPIKSKALIENCYRIIDEKYNPYFQIEVMKEVLLIGGI